MHMDHFAGFDRLLPLKLHQNDTVHFIGRPEGSTKMDVCHGISTRRYYPGKEVRAAAGESSPCWPPLFPARTRYKGRYTQYGRMP
jgi:hypothetical protein